MKNTQKLNQPGTAKPRTLTISDLAQVRGGTSDSNIMKTKHDTVKNTISNIH